MASSAKVMLGTDELSATLKSIPLELRNEVLPRVMKRAADLVARRAKVFASDSRRTGALSSSIISLVRQYKNGTVVGVAGPDNNYYRGRHKLSKKDNRIGAEQPRRYAHLIEHGHFIAKGGKLRDVFNKDLTWEFSQSGKLRRRWRKTTVKEKATGTKGGFVAARPFMRPALLGATAAIRNEMVKGLDSALKSARRKGIKAGTFKA